MATKSMAADPMKDVRAAWKHTHTAWAHVEKSLTDLAKAEATLLVSLRKAGTVFTKKAATEIRATMKDLDKKRKGATRQFDKLTQRHSVMHRTPAARKEATPGL